MNHEAMERVQQHLAWMRLYVEEMTEADWKDMRDRMARQLDEIKTDLAIALG